MAEPESQDYIAALEAQRNSAMNEVVNLRAKVAALEREMAARERTNSIPPNNVLLNNHEY